MGAHTNYYALINFLLRVKKEYHRINILKFKELIALLRIYPYDPNLYENKIPDCDELAMKLQYKKAKVQKLLKDLRSELLEDFLYNPIQIPNIEHEIIISIPWDEVGPSKNPWYKDYVHENSLSISAKLPVTPRIGERINLTSLNDDVIFKSGYIYNIDHEITPNTQRIVIWVHPFKNYYYHWMKMKKNFENDDGWLKRNSFR